VQGWRHAKSTLQGIDEHEALIAYLRKWPMSKTPGTANDHFEKNPRRGSAFS
jgi:hypothetical protein